MNNNNMNNQLTIQINDRLFLNNSDKKFIEKKLKLDIVFFKSVSAGSAESLVTIQDVGLLFNVNKYFLFGRGGQTFYSLSPTMHALYIMSTLSREARSFVKKIYFKIIADPDYLAQATKVLGVDNVRCRYQDSHSVSNFSNAFNLLLDPDKETIDNTLSNNIVYSLIVITLFIEGAGLLSGTSADAHQIVFLTMLLGFSCAGICRK